MKLKSVVPMLTALLGLALMPAVSHASTTPTKPVTTPSQPPATYGAFVTNNYYGSIRVFTINNKLCSQDFWIQGYGGSVWNVEYYCCNSLSITVDAQLNLHSAMTAWTYFTGGPYNNEPAVATINVTIPVSGPQTVGIQVMDYMNPTTVLYSSGTASSGSLQQLPISQGGFTITH